MTVLTRVVFISTRSACFPPRRKSMHLWPGHQPRQTQQTCRQLLADNAGYAEHWMSFWNDMLRNDYAGTGYIDGGRKQITAGYTRHCYNNMPYNKFVAALINPTPDCAGFINGIVWRGAVSASQRKRSAGGAECHAGLSWAELQMQFLSRQLHQRLEARRFLRPGGRLRR